MNKSKILLIISVFILIIGVWFLGFIFSNKGEVTKDYELTASMIEDFLSPLVGDGHNFLLGYHDMNDSIIFINIIRSLVLEEKYSKTNYIYTFNQLDIEECAKNIFNRDNFNYKINDSNFIYDNDLKTVSSALDFGIFAYWPVKKEKATVINYDINGEIINVKYVVDFTYNGVADHSEIYAIQLAHDDNGLRMISVLPLAE